MLIRSVLKRVAEIAVEGGQVRRRGEFQGVRTMTNSTFRTVESARAVDWFALEEAAGIVAYLAKKFTMLREDLMKAIISEMGYGRMRLTLQTLNGAGLELLEARSRVIVYENRISPAR